MTTMITPGAPLRSATGPNVVAAFDQFDPGRAGQINVLPQLSLGNDRLMVFNEPDSPGAEQFRSLRNTLALRWFKHPDGALTLAVVSVAEHEGSGAVAANLAVAFAQVGYKTLLIDADMRTPSPEQVGSLGSNPGLAGYLASWAGNPLANGSFPISNPTVIPAGDFAPNPQDLLVGGGLANLLNEAKQQFEVILVNTPPASTAQDYLLIGAETIGVLIVTLDGQSLASAAKLVKDCHEFGIRVVGSLMLEKQ